jgi:predicted ArsR family transcriptional regulator
MPDRRIPAGLVPSLEEGDRFPGLVLDMERALGALRDFTRRDILLRFYSDQKARSVDDVATAAGVHRSVAFDHLERLVALGYLEVERRRGFPGKPAKIYRLAAGPVQISHPARRYDLVAEALARALDVEAITGAGRTFGRSLSRPGVTSLAKAIEPMIDLGAEYEIDRATRIVCTNCLFAEACRRAPTICNFHAGLIEGLSGLTGCVRALSFHGAGGCAYAVDGI